MRKDNGFLSFFYFLLEFWRAFACPSHGECSLSLLMNQFRGSWIPLQVGWWRGNSYLSLDINEGFLVSVLRSINLNSHLSPYSLIPSSPFPHTLMLMPHLLEWCLIFYASRDFYTSYLLSQDLSLCCTDERPIFPPGSSLSPLLGLL